MNKKPVDQAAVDAAIAALAGALRMEREHEAQRKASKARVLAALAEVDREYERCQADAVAGRISSAELDACRKARAIAHKQVRVLFAEEAV
jgi:multidrug resistance efflux pump